MHERFRRGLGTCSKVFAHVLAAMTGFANDIIRPRDTSYAVVPAELVKYSPFFDGCIGAMDGTHIDVIVDQGVRDNHINRKGRPTQNVIAVCDFDMRFTQRVPHMICGSKERQKLMPLSHIHRQVS